MKYIIFIASIFLVGCSTQSNIIRLNEVQSNSKNLSMIFKDVNIVSLGESIHMTKELPIARLGILNYLNTDEGFDIVLFEGSTLDSWLASDFLLSNNNPVEEDFIKARNIAFFPLWRTESYKMIVESFYKTWSSDHPIYLASYDLQPGMGLYKAEVLNKLIKAISVYSKPSQQTLKTVKELFVFSDRQKGFPNAILDFKKIEQSITVLDEWIKVATPIIQQRYPNIPHGKVLAIIPFQLRRQLTLWKEHLKNKEQNKVYQETRDRLSSEVIKEFADFISPHKKVIVWAHNVHVFHNTLGKARLSLGSVLKKELKSKVYTIGTMAGSGQCFSLNGEDVKETVFDLPRTQTLETMLASISPSDFFTDFKTVKNRILEKFLSSAGVTGIEGHAILKVIPNEDFDGAIFVHKVSRPQIDWK